MKKLATFGTVILVVALAFGVAEAATTTIRPNGTVSNNCVQRGGTTAHGATSDDNATTGISSQGIFAGGANCAAILDFGTYITVTPITSVTLRASIKLMGASASGGVGTFYMYPRLGTTDGSVTFACSPGSTTATICSSGAITNKPGGGSWTQTDIDGLRIHLFMDDEQTSSCDDSGCWIDEDNATETLEVYADVVDASGATTTVAPTTTTTTIAPTTTTTLPPTTTTLLPTTTTTLPPTTTTTLPPTTTTTLPCSDATTYSEKKLCKIASEVESNRAESMLGWTLALLVLGLLTGLRVWGK